MHLGLGAGARGRGMEDSAGTQNLDLGPALAQFRLRRRQDGLQGFLPDRIEGRAGQFAADQHPTGAANAHAEPAVFRNQAKLLVGQGLQPAVEQAERIGGQRQGTAGAKRAGQAGIQPSRQQRRGERYAALFRGDQTHAIRRIEVQQGSGVGTGNAADDALEQRAIAG